MVKQIGPNVSISANARIGAGVRLISCIILDGVEIMVCNRIQCFQIALKTLTEVPLNLTHDWFALSRLMTQLFCFQENAVVFHAIVGWKSSIGKWSRVQASLTYGYFYMILMTKSYVILDFFYKCSTYVSNTYSDVGLRYDRKNLENWAYPFWIQSCIQHSLPSLGNLGRMFFRLIMNTSLHKFPLKIVSCRMTLSCSSTCHFYAKFKSTRLIAGWRRL